MDPPPVTFAFQTRKGELGILQVVRFTEEPRGIRIRYKLAQAPVAPPLRALPWRGSRSVPTSPVPAPLAPATPPMALQTAKVTRGDIAATIGVSGWIEVEKLVKVNTQVSGMIKSLGDDPRGKTDPQYKGKTVDYGTPVEKGTILARIDDALHKAMVEEAEAGVRRAEAELRRAQETETSWTRQAAAAALDQRKAVLKQAKIKLENTVIRSPVKGVIVSHWITAGQNVASGPKAPSLFQIAKDTGRLRLRARFKNDHRIRWIREGMTAKLTFDTLPKETFKGKVARIHMDVKRTKDVRSGAVLVDIDSTNPRLIPKMEAGVEFEIESRNVLLAPNAALQWRPRSTKPFSQKLREAQKSMPNPGLLWIVGTDGINVQPIAVSVGLSNGTLTEVSGPDVKEGMQVVIGP